MASKMSRGLEVARRRRAQKQVGFQVGQSIDLGAFFASMQAYRDQLQREWDPDRDYTADKVRELYQETLRISSRLSAAADAFQRQRKVPTSVKRDIIAAWSRALRTLQPLARYAMPLERRPADEVFKAPELKDLIMAVLQQVQFSWESLEDIKSVQAWYLKTKAADVTLASLEALTKGVQTSARVVVRAAKTAGKWTAEHAPLVIGLALAAAAGVIFIPPLLARRQGGGAA